jgi:hypothetical protein
MNTWSLSSRRSLGALSAVALCAVLTLSIFVAGAAGKGVKCVKGAEGGGLPAPRRSALHQGAEGQCDGHGHGQRQGLLLQRLRRAGQVHQICPGARLRTAAGGRPQRQAPAEGRQDLQAEGDREPDRSRRRRTTGTRTVRSDGDLQVGETGRREGPRARRSRQRGVLRRRCNLEPEARTLRPGGVGRR